MEHSFVLLVVFAGCGHSEISQVIPVPAEQARVKLPQGGD